MTIQNLIEGSRNVHLITLVNFEKSPIRHVIHMQQFSEMIIQFLEGL